MYLQTKKTPIVEVVDFVCSLNKQVFYKEVFNLSDKSIGREMLFC